MFRAEIVVVLILSIAAVIGASAAESQEAIRSKAELQKNKEQTEPGDAGRATRSSTGQDTIRSAPSQSRPSSTQHQETDLEFIRERAD